VPGAVVGGLHDRLEGKELAVEQGRPRGCLVLVQSGEQERHERVEAGWGDRVLVQVVGGHRSPPLERSVVRTERRVAGRAAPPGDSAGALHGRLLPWTVVLNGDRRGGRG
jgi:hypothetical protein